MRVCAVSFFAGALFTRCVAFGGAKRIARLHYAHRTAPPSTSPRTQPCCRAVPPRPRWSSRWCLARLGLTTSALTRAPHQGGTGAQRTPALFVLLASSSLTTRPARVFSARWAGTARPALGIPFPAARESTYPVGRGFSALLSATMHTLLDSAVHLMPPLPFFLSLVTARKEQLRVCLAGRAHGATSPRAAAGLFLVHLAGKSCPRGYGLLGNDCRRPLLAPRSLPSRKGGRGKG